MGAFHGKKHRLWLNKVAESSLTKALFFFPQSVCNVYVKEDFMTKGNIVLLFPLNRIVGLVL